MSLYILNDFDANVNPSPKLFAIPDEKGYNTPMERTLIAIGGGELKTKTTLKIDEYLVSLARAHAGEARPYALFLPTASHDSMPYFNSFRKIYTSVFDVKADVALTVYGEMDGEKILGKIRKADLIYAGGGDTLFMLDTWREKGILDALLEAYRGGVPLAGLSAGGICWFESMFTDYNLMRGKGSDYEIKEGLGLLRGTVCPHYAERAAQFDPLVPSLPAPVYAAENDAAIVFRDETPAGAVSSGGKAYRLSARGGQTVREEIPLLSNAGAL